MASASSASLSSKEGSIAAKKQPTNASLRTCASTSSLPNKNSKSTDSLKSVKPVSSITASTFPATANVVVHKPAEEQRTAVKETKKPPLAVASSDDELMEFERLEEYVEEHPSFRSSTSFVDSIFAAPASFQTSANTSKNDTTSELAKMLKELQLSNPGNSKLSYMLSLISHESSGRKLADLSEEAEENEEEIESMDKVTERERQNEEECALNGYGLAIVNNFDYGNENEDEEEREVQFGLSENGDELDDDDDAIVQKQLVGKSDESSKVMVVRKIKRIQQQANGIIEKKLI